MEGNIPKIDEKFICPICQEIISNAQELTTCSHCFCKKCLTSLLNTGTETQYNKYHNLLAALYARKISQNQKLKKIKSLMKK
jgi:hypothetical protein